MQRVIKAEQSCIGLLQSHVHINNQTFQKNFKNLRFSRLWSRGTYLNYGAGAVWTREGSIVTTEGRGRAAGQGTAGLLAADFQIEAADLQIG